MGDYNWCMKHKGRNVNVFDMANKLRADLQILIPEIEPTRYISILSHCRNEWIRNTTKKPIKKQWQVRFTEVERVVYDYLLKNKINPQTAYKLFLCTRLPTDVTNQLYKGQISQKSAVHIAQNRIKGKMSNLGLLMSEEIKNIMETFRYV